MFGGFNGRYLGDTWEWDGTSWRRVANSGPEARTNHAMAYDGARGVTVLHGGNTRRGETWEWDGNSWALRATGGVQFGTMDYDSARAVTVLTDDNQTRAKIAFGRLKALRSAIERKLPEVDAFDEFVEKGRRHA